MSTIDRIQKLIALSASENEHEARSAAHLACKLIREGGYRVVAAAPPERPAIPHAWEDPFGASAWSPPPRPPAPPRRSPPDTRARRRVPNEIVRAKWSGRCAVCSELYEEGSDVAQPVLASDTHLGKAHADCRSQWTVPVEP